MPTDTLPMTVQQKRVYTLLKKGATPAEIARKLNRSRSAVHVHMRNMRNAGITLPGEGDATSTNGHRPVDDDQVVGIIKDHIAKEEGIVRAVEQEIQEAQEELLKMTAQRDEAIERRARYERMVAAA